MQQVGSARSLDALRLRFELIYSRVNLLQRGDVNQLLQQIPVAKRLLPDLVVLMTDIDSLLDEIDQSPIFRSGITLSLARASSC